MNRELIAPRNCFPVVWIWKVESTTSDLNSACISGAVRIIRDVSTERKSSVTRGFVTSPHWAHPFDNQWTTTDKSHSKKKKKKIAQPTCSQRLTTPRKPLLTIENEIRVVHHQFVRARTTGVWHPSRKANNTRLETCKCQNGEGYASKPLMTGPY
jgi:hypothetical protein